MKYEEWIERVDDYLAEGYALVLMEDTIKVAVLSKDNEYYRLDDEGVLKKMSEEEFLKIKERIAKPDTKKGDEKKAVKPPSQKRIEEPSIPASALPEKKETIFHVEQFTGIPKEFLVRLGDEVYVRRAGLLYKAEKKGFRALQVELSPLPEDNGFLAKAILYPKITKEEVELVKAAQGLDPEVQKEILKNLFVPFIEYATASPKNVRMQSMIPYLRELASTRAVNRVLRAFVACGFTSVEETPDYVEE